MGAQLAHGFVVLLDVVGGDAERLADDGDSAGAGHRRLRVLVRPVGVEVEQAAGGDEVLGDHGRVLLVQGPQLAEDLLVEFAAGDAFGDLGFLDAGTAGALLACVFAGIGLARSAAIVVAPAAASASPTAVVIAALALIAATTVIVTTLALIAATTIIVTTLALVPASAVIVAAAVLPLTTPTVVIATLALVPASAIVVPALALVSTTAVRMTWPAAAPVIRAAVAIAVAI